MNKNFTLLVISLLFFATSNLFATVYTSTQDGDYDDDATWGGSGPPTTLPAGDEVIINHAIVLDKDVVIRGKLTINSGKSLIGNKKLEVGKDASTGELINNGTIDVKDLNIKGNNSSGDINVPSMTNFGSVTADKIHVGNNDGFGKLTNNSSGTITVNGELHLDNILSNSGAMTITGKLKNHGGNISGGGTIENCEVEFEANGSRKGTFISQDLCCDFMNDTEADFKVKGGPTYSSLVDFVDNNGGLEGTDYSIDGVNFLSCGESYQKALPVELTDFRAREDQQHNVVLYWATASESNNMHFVIERAADGRTFDALETVNGNGTTTVGQVYSYVDTKPISFAYYRLKQVDYDRNFEYSDVIFWEMKKTQNDKILAFPTIAENQINLRIKTLGTKKSILKIVNTHGRIVYNESIYTNDVLEYRKIDLSNFETGVYSIILSDGFAVFTTKFVVIKTY